MAMASSKVVARNPDLGRQSSVCSLSSLLAEAEAEADPSTSTSNSKNNNMTMDMDDLLNSIYSSEPNPEPPITPKTVDEVWKEIVAGTNANTTTQSQSQSQSQSQQHMTLEDFLTKAAAAPLPTHFPIPTANANIIPPPPPPRGKRRAVEEPLVDKATLQKQRRMIKNRESAARSRERKQAYTVELESLVLQLEEENARLLREEADNNKQRLKQLMECLIPVVEKRKPRRKLRRVNSVQW